MRLLRVLLMATIALCTCVSCGKEAPFEDVTQKDTTVTYSTIEGCWQLTHLDGTELLTETMLYAKFSRHDRSFELWDNIGSMYMRKSTGYFTITQDESGACWLSGRYDNGVGDWMEEYRIEMLDAERMQLRATSCMEFKRIERLPEFNQ